MTTNETTIEAAKNVLDLASVSAILAVLVGWLTPVTIVFTCLWAVFRALNEYEKWKHYRKERHKRKEP